MRDAGKNAPNDIRVLLFDVGGVLVRLSGVEAMLEWLGHRISAQQVRTVQPRLALASEARPPVEPRQFLEAFIRWPTGLYPGTLELLARIPSSYQ